MPIFLMINKNMGFNMPKDRIVNIVNISAYFVCVLYIWCAMIVSMLGTGENRQKVSSENRHF